MVQDPDIKSVPESPTEKPQSNGNEQTDLQAASQAMVDYSHLMPQLHEKKKWPRTLGWILLALVVLAGLGVGGYWLVKDKPFSKPKPNTAHHAAVAAKAKQAPATTQYTSSGLNLTLNYPKTWQLKDLDIKLTVTSPPTSLTDASGQKQTGQIILDIEAQNSEDLSAFTKGSAVAVLPSQSFAFTQPTSSQQASTYLSFLQYATTTTKGGLDGIYVTGNAGYQYAQQIPQSDIAGNNPLIRVIFTKCSNAQCTGTITPLTINSTMWKNASFSTPITAMLKSLQLQ